MIRSLRFLVPASILAMFLSEAALILASYVAAVYLNPDPQGFLIDKSGWQPIIAAAAVILLGMHFRQLYGDLRIRSRILLFQELSLVMGAVFIVEALMTYFQSDWALPRNVLLRGSAIALATVYVWRILFSAAIRNRLGVQRVLFIGFPPAAGKVTAYLERHPAIGFAAVGYLDGNQTGASAKIPFLGSPAQLNETIERHHPDWIVIGARRGIAPAQVDDLVDLRFGGVRIEDVESFYERTTGRAHAANFQPARAILPENLLPNPVNFRCQSIYATLAALVLLPVAAPLIGAVALAIRIATRRPALLRERRIGLGGAPFTAYRLRSLPERPGLDRFVTGWGLWRLPRIWNVLRGDMSLVGPEADRPLFADRLSQDIPFYSWRVLVRPGLIGWAQLRERADRSGPDAIRRLEYDLYYIKNLSPLLDLFIVLRWLRAALPFAESDNV